MVRRVLTPRKLSNKAKNENPPEINVQAGSRLFAAPRSGETRTRGFDIPNVARCQLRHTPVPDHYTRNPRACQAPSASFRAGGGSRLPDMRPHRLCRLYGSAGSADRARISRFPRNKTETSAYCACTVPARRWRAESSGGRTRGLRRSPWRCFAGAWKAPANPARNL